MTRATITTKSGLTITEPESLSGLGINWDGYQPSMDEHVLMDEIIPVLKKSKNDAEIELAGIRARISARAGVRRGLEKAQAFSRTLMEFRNTYGSDLDEKERAAVEEWIGVTTSMTEGRMFYTDSTAKADIDMIEDDLKFLNGATFFFAKDAELDKLLYAIHKVDAKYRRKVFRDSFRLMMEVNESLQTVILSRSVIKNSIWNVIGHHIDGCRVIYKNLIPAFREIKRRLAKGDADCLNGPMPCLTERDCIDYTNKMVERELAKESAA